MVWRWQKCFFGVSEVASTMPPQKHFFFGGWVGGKHTHPPTKMVSEGDRSGSLVVLRWHRRCHLRTIFFFFGGWVVFFSGWVGRWQYPKPAKNTQNQWRTPKSSREHPKPVETTQRHPRSPKTMYMSYSVQMSWNFWQPIFISLVISKTIFYQTKPNRSKIYPNHQKVSYCHTESTSVGIFENRCL